MHGLFIRRGNALNVTYEKLFIIDWVILKNKIEVRSFLGLANFNNIFAEGFSKLVVPIIVSLKK